jgi:TPR repeat protein
MTFGRSIAAMLLIAGALGVARADFAAGVAAYEKQDYATAAKEWEPLAKSGDAAAQFNLGLLYLDGQGKPQNYSEAVLWFRRAADQGYGKAQLNLGAMYGSGRGVKRDYVQAYKWLTLCAAEGVNGCAPQRDLVAKKLNGSKLTEAQRMASDWKPTKEK